MRFLVNEHIPPTAVRRLRELGHDVLSVKENMAGSADSAVLARAAVEQRVLVTFDKDFGELAFRSRLPAGCGVILLRFAARPRTGCCACGEHTAKPQRLVGGVLDCNRRERPATFSPAGHAVNDRSCGGFRGIDSRFRISAGRPWIGPSDTGAGAGWATSSREPLTGGGSRAPDSQR
jgi:hypothetical protein